MAICCKCEEDKPDVAAREQWLPVCDECATYLDYLFETFIDHSGPTEQDLLWLDKVAQEFKLRENN